MIYGKMPEQTDGILKLDGPYSLLCKDLISRILNPTVDERLTAEEILQHEWFADTPDTLDIFDE